MSEMVQKVARAIRKASNAETTRQDYVLIARAAIKAMQEPTEDMLNAVPVPPGAIREYWRTGGLKIMKKYYRLMIQAALHEGGTQ